MPLHLSSLAVIALGATLGAWLRWGLGLLLNPWLGPLPLGTLAANWLGAYLIGVALMLFELHLDLPAELKLMVITGFLGGLTTFSSFSAEVMAQLQRADYGWAALTLLLHVGGSLLLTALGIVSVMQLAK